MNLPKRITVRPTKEQITRYIEEENCDCPFVQAIQEKYPQFSHVEVDGYSTNIETEGDEARYFPTPEDSNSLEKFVIDVDHAQYLYANHEGNPFITISPNVPRPTIHFVLDDD